MSGDSQKTFTHRDIWVYVDRHKSSHGATKSMDQFLGGDNQSRSSSGKEYRVRFDNPGFENVTCVAIRDKATTARFLSLQLPIMLTREAWARHDLSLYDIGIVLKTFHSKYLWRLCLREKILVANQSIKPSFENDHSIIHGGMAIALSKLCKFYAKNLDLRANMPNKVICPSSGKRYKLWKMISKTLSSIRPLPSPVIEKDNERVHDMKIETFLLQKYYQLHFDNVYVIKHPSTLIIPTHQVPRLFWRCVVYELSQSRIKYLDRVSGRNYGEKSLYRDDRDHQRIDSDSVILNSVFNYRRLFKWKDIEIIPISANKDSNQILVVRVINLKDYQRTFYKPTSLSDEPIYTYIENKGVYSTCDEQFYIVPGP